jgi:hypothetical protein
MEGCAVARIQRADSHLRMHPIMQGEVYSIGRLEIIKLPAKPNNTHSLSSASRTLDAKLSMEKGFWMKWVSSFNMPWEAMTSAV